MAIVYGVNNTKQFITNPSEKVKAKEQSGKVRFAYDSFVFTGAVFAAASTIELMKLPAGAKVISAVVKAPSLGTTGIFDLGWKANGVDVADPNGLVSAADAGGQAVAKSMALEAGLFKEFSVETQLELVATEATDVATGLMIEVAVSYVME